MGNILLFIWQDGHDADDSKQNTTDMTAFVQNLLQQMQTRFQAMSESITFGYLTAILLDEMGNRIDELEQSIKDLKAEMGPDESASPVPSSKSTPVDDGGKPEETSNTSNE
ncbi:Heat shock factor-binding protein [Bienertia sinuspersici]